MFCLGYDDAYHKASAVYFKLNLMLPPWLAEMLMQPKKTHTFAMKKKYILHFTWQFVSV